MTSQSADAFASSRTLKRQSTSPRTLFTSRVMTVLSFTCAAIALVPLVLVLYYVVAQGSRAVGPRSVYSATRRRPHNQEQPTSTRVGLVMPLVGTLMTVGFGSIVQCAVRHFGSDLSIRVC